MFERLKEAANSARLRAGQMWREHRERSEAKKATAALNSEHGHGRFFLLHVPATATVLAAFVEWYWAILFCIEATGSVDWNYETAIGAGVASTSLWNFAFSTHWPVFIGLVCATVPIVMLSMVWLPVQFSMRGSGRWRRGSVIAVGVLANILVIVSGTVVMNYNRQDQVREAVVMEQTAAQGRAAIDARLEFAREELRIATTNTNPYLNQAANVGAVEWERSYVAQARATNDPRLPQLERALGAARRADALRADIERLTIERATAAPEAASAANVTDTVGAELNTFAQYVEVWRPPFIAVICTLIGIFGAWWVLALMQGLNPRDVMRSGWADEGHRIEDLREEPSVAAQPMKPPREVVTDAETGEELIKITPKPHWRKQKGKKQKVEFSPDIPPAETGVEHDGGGRVGSVAQGVAESVKHASDSQQDSADQEQPDDQPGGDQYAPNDQREEPDEKRGVDTSADVSAELQTEPSNTAEIPADEFYNDPDVFEALSGDELAAEGADDQENGNNQAARAEYANEQVGEDFVSNSYGEGHANEAENNAEQGAAADDADQITDQDAPPREPETNPARMIAAE